MTYKIPKVKKISNPQILSKKNFNFINDYFNNIKINKIRLR